VAQGRPAEYVAHHYTRYLGDLSGGQVIGAMIERHYGATPEQLTFFSFEGIEKPVPYKREYRTALDALELTD
jgi:heme oxygenase (biliverdin-producing, ferredoxin)